MNLEELQYLQANRVEGETINEARARLEKHSGFPETKIAGNERQACNDLDFGQDLTILRYKVVQPQCRIEGATAGYYRNMLTEEEFERLENVVLLTQQNSRSLFPQDDFSGMKRCFSYNGYVMRVKLARKSLFRKTLMRASGL